MDRHKPILQASNIQELDGTTLELCKLSNLIDKIQKDIGLLQHNSTAQQATLEFFNRHTMENLQTSSRCMVHQLVHI